MFIPHDPKMNYKRVKKTKKKTETKNYKKLYKIKMKKTLVEK